MDLEYKDGQTPLSESDKEELLIEIISTQKELDEYEQLNIEKAMVWIYSTKIRKDTILTEKFIKNLHKKMFGDVWGWAGKFRRIDTNIGVDWVRIPVELRQLLDNTQYWIDNKVFPPDEIAIRFKHKLVNIHCFPNGNGRHSRIMADIIIETIFDKEIYTWNDSNMVKADETRDKYISAIREGDKGDIKPLISFARS